MGLSDYFDFHGRFLGSDNSTEDYIRIITENDWKSICFSDHRGNLIVDAELGLRLSKPFSKANLDSESSLYIWCMSISTIWTLLNMDYKDIHQ